MMFTQILTPWQRLRLREPGAVIVDRADLDSLGTPEGGTAWVNNHAVHIAAAVDGLRGLGGANVIASLATAREIAGSHASTYFVARVRAGARPEAVQQRLSHTVSSFGPYEAWTAQSFARRSQRYWMFDTGAGAGVLFMAIIVCLVGSVVTSQSLKAVVAGSAREYAVLNALGVSRGALGRVVVEQACWIGGLGFVLAGLASALLLSIASAYRVPVALNLAAVLACAVLVAVLSLLSGLGAMRSLLRADPATLLR
jgi:putative ABC transport system permease protein